MTVSAFDAVKFPVCGVVTFPVLQLQFPAICGKVNSSEVH